MKQACMHAVSSTVARATPCHQMQHLSSGTQYIGYSTIRTAAPEAAAEDGTIVRTMYHSPNAEVAQTALLQLKHKTHTHFGLLGRQLRQSNLGNSPASTGTCHTHSGAI